MPKVNARGITWTAPKGQFEAAGRDWNAMRAKTSIRPIHLYAWLWEPLEEEASFVLRPMFGTRAAYLDGRLMLCFSANAEPWRGVLVCTERQHHDSLMREFPNLAPHPILPKWLYLPDSASSFEATAEQLVRRVRQRDPRIGVEPGAAKRKRR